MTRLARHVRAASLGRLLNRPPKLSPVMMELNAAVPAWVMWVIAATLPALMVIAVPLRLGFGVPVTIAFAVVAIGLVALFWWRPAVSSALIAIGLAAASGLTRPVSLGWALAVAGVGYLAFRSAIWAQQVPRSGLIERRVLIRSGGWDLGVLGATIIAGVVAIAGRRLTGCYVTGASIGDANLADLPGAECSPAGSALVIVAALALSALMLGLVGKAIGKMAA